MRPSRSSASITISGSETGVDEEAWGWVRGSRARARAMTTVRESSCLSGRTAERAGVTRGTSSPIGATPGPDGVNFTVFSRHATGIELLLFDGVDDRRPSRVISIDPVANRTYHYWHVFVPGVTSG